MIFYWEFVKTKCLHETATQKVEPGKAICGLLRRQQRPYTVSFDINDVYYFIKHPEYFYNNVIPALGNKNEC